MSPLRGLAFVVSTLVIVFGWAGPVPAAGAVGEAEKIEGLIRAVEEMKDAKFVRNDVEYSGRDAAKHMRLKWSWQKTSIKTARDFIRLVATRSSETGRPYLIRFRDGREVKAAEFLDGELDKLEGKRGKQ